MQDSLLNLIKIQPWKQHAHTHMHEPLSTSSAYLEFKRWTGGAVRERLFNLIKAQIYLFN